MEICVHSGLPITMVPCLHQNNIYIKRKLRGRGAHKCKLCVGETTVGTTTRLQTAPFPVAPNRADNGNLHTFGAT